jgi:hypothetical protein
MQTSAVASLCDTTGDRNTPQCTSKARSPGSGSRIPPRSLASLRATDSPERFIRTLKEQCLWARLYEDLEDLRLAVIKIARRYNSEWLIERHGHCTPREAYAAAMDSKAA